jgi:hypothetical protein
VIAPVVAALALALAAPPSPATWPRYPSFTQHSCWTRSPFPGPPLQSAPSYAPAPKASPTPPRLVVSRLLARFGDSSLVKAVSLGRPPAITLTHLKGYYGGKRPPKDALWAYVSAPAVDAELSPGSPPDAIVQESLAEWEAGLVAGALRDAFCSAGGAPLVGWSIGRTAREVSDHAQAQGQRFPNPRAADFVTAVGDAVAAANARVVSVRLLRPLGIAPVVVVQTDEDRKAFVKRIPALVAALDPRTPGKRAVAFAFEGFFFVAEDGSGMPFVMTQSIRRGQMEGGEWAWDPCYMPYPHSTPGGAPPCPPDSPQGG